MRSVLRAFLVCFLFGIGIFPGGANNKGAGNVSQSPPATFAELPMAFEPNQGQVDEKVRFISRGSGYTLFLTSEEAVLLLRRPSDDKARAAVVRMRFVGANRKSTITGSQELPGKSNYLRGRDPAKWQTNISNFGRVHYEGVYPGVDASFYGNQGRLEYDFVVAPGVKPEVIRLGFDGIETVAVGLDGDLLLETAIGEVRLSKPILYQETDGIRNEIVGRYLLLGDKEVGFKIGRYDPGKPLVIDPQLLYATYLSGSTTEDGFAVAVDSAGDAYVTGQTFSANFPTSFGAFQTVRLGSGEVFVTKLSPVAADGAGSDLVYSTFIGGTANDIARDVAVDDATGNACVVGDTLSRLDFPITANAFQNTTAGAGDVFMTCLDSTGTSLVYSTFLSGNNGSVGRGIDVDASGGVYVTGRADSADFPTKNAFQAAFGGSTDVFVAKIDPAQSGPASLIYSTFLGGFTSDVGEDIAVDSSGAAYVTGQTLSTNSCCALFPTRNAAQPSPGANGSRDAFVAKINPSLTGDASLVYSTFLGGTSAENSTAEDGGIAVDSLGAAYVTGATVSADFPVTAGAYQSVPSALGDAFLVKLNAAGNLFLYSTFLGGSGSDKGTDVAVDSSGRAYVTGYTGSVDFPTSDAFQAVNNGSPDAFVTQIDPSQSGNASLGYSSYLGGNSLDQGYGIAVDGSGNAYVGGTTAGSTFPATAGAFGTQTSGGRDAFLAKIGATNSSPAATDDAYEVDEDNSLTIATPGILTNDTDDDGDPLTAVLVTNVVRGMLTLNANGSFTYDPDPNFNGADAFTYKANDGTADSNVATVTITVRPVNDAPVAFDEAYTVNEDEVLDVGVPGVLANDTDADLDALTAVLATDVVNGTLTLNADGSFRYTPDPDFSGADTFSYVANDGTANSAPATVALTVVPVNDPPVGVDDAYAVDEDQSLTIAAPGLLDNDTDVDGDTLASGLAANPTNGTLVQPGDGSFTYTPDPDFNGTDTFQYIPRDGTVDGNVTTVTITVRPINDPPVAGDDAYAVDEDGTLIVEDVPGEDILENDTDVEGDPLTATLVTSTVNGSLNLNANGSFTYSPDPDFNGIDTFTYVANDGTVNSNVATVTITVNPVNDPPVGVDDAYGVDEDQSLTIAAPGLLDNDTDVDGDTLASGLAANPTNGTLVQPGDGSFTYTPDPDFNGTDTFQYIPRDGAVDGNVTTVTITVRPINDPPRTVDDIALTLEDAPTTINVLTNDVDPDGDPLGVDQCSPPLHGRLTINPDQTLTYTPDPNFNGSDTVDCNIIDGQGGSATSRVTFTVTPVNDPPVAVDDIYSVNEDETLTIPAPGVLGNDTDVEGDSLTVALLSSIPLDVTLIFNSDGSFTYTPPPNFDGSHSFIYVAKDGTDDSNNATFTIDVLPINDRPLTTDDSATTLEDQPVTLNILLNDVDPDGDPLDVDQCSPPLKGRITINPDRTLTYTPDPDANGSDTADCNVIDGQGGSATSRVTFTVMPVNDPPVAVDDIYSVNEDETLTIPAPGVLGNDTDVEGDSLTVALLSSIPLDVTLIFNSDGSFTYTPPPNFDGSHSFIYVAKDGTDDSNNATFTIDVLPINDRPLTTDDSATTLEDQPVTLNILLNDVDPDGDALDVDQCSPPLKGRITINPDRTLTYTPDPDTNGSDTADCNIIDGQGGSATSRATFTVTPVNDPPLGVDDSYIVNEDQALTVPASGGVLANDTDVEGDPLTATPATSVGSGTVTLNADGSFTYIPNPDFNGSDTFTYVPNDGAVDGNITTVTIRVNPVNDPPVAIDDNASTAEDTSITTDVLGNDSDSDGDSLTITSVSAPANGIAVIQGTGISYTPDPDFNGQDTFSYTISDGQASAAANVTIDVAPVNDAPVALDDSATTAEDTPVTVEILTNDSDPENDPITVDAASAPSNGTASINPNGTILYTPGPNFHGTDSFVYTISDSQGDSATATVNMIVTPVNDPPVARDDTATTTAGSAVVINVLGNDSDVDGDTLSVTVVTDPPSGSANVNTDRTVTYNPDSGFTGTDAFSYTASDGSGLTATANVTVTVNADGIEVSIDIRPGDRNNRINLQSNGVLPVAVFSTSEFDATTIDPATVTLAGAPIRVRGNGRRLVLRIDLNRDRVPDLLTFFSIQELELTVADRTAVLRGRTTDGTRIQGEDSVQVSDGRVRLRNNAVFPSLLYSTLQDAVDAVRENGTVRVLAGRYEIDAPIFIERNVTIRGAGCSECREPRSGGGSGGRPAGRSTELVGPTPTTVVEADLVIGLLNYAADTGGAGGGGIAGRGGGGGKVRDIMLRGFDAGIVGRDTRRPLSIENVSMADTTRGILWMAPSPLAVNQVKISHVSWNAISLVGDSQSSLPYSLTNLILDDIGNAGIYVVDKPGTCDSEHAIKNATIQSTKFGGIVVIRSGLCILDSTIRFNFFAGIRAIDSAVFVKDTLVSNTLPRLSDNGYGDGIFVISTKEPRSTLGVVDSEVRQSSRAGVTVFGSVATLKGFVGECNSLDINTESTFLVAPPDDPEQEISLFPTLDDQGGNTCGCGAADPPTGCEAVSSQLTPPLALGNQP